MYIVLVAALTTYCTTTNRFPFRPKKYQMVDQGPAVDAQCPSWAASLGYMGVAIAVCLSNWGSAVSEEVEYC